MMFTSDRHHTSSVLLLEPETLNHLQQAGALLCFHCRIQKCQVAAPRIPPWRAKRPVGKTLNVPRGDPDLVNPAQVRSGSKKLLVALDPNAHIDWRCRE